MEDLAFAKLNISLDVTQARDDGFHDMVMVMQTVSLCDIISVTVNGSGLIHSVCNLSFIPSDRRNLAVKAAELFYSASGISNPGLDIEIKKSIPVGAGMAGGSADAAAVLRILNRMNNNVLNNALLLNLAAEIGSDVPYCVMGGTALAEGRGERLSPLNEIPDCLFVICKPNFSISTPELFRKLDEVKLRVHPDTSGITEAISRCDLDGMCRRMYNVFEDVDDRRMRTVQNIKSALISSGALGAIMTGTGSAVFGVFPPDFNASGICSDLKKEYGFCVQASPVPRLL